MPQELNVKNYSRKVTPLERWFTRSPYSIVTIVARIEGSVTEERLTNAVSKVQQRHPNLRVRIEEDDNHDLWFTSEGAQDIPIEIVPRESDDDWITVYHEAVQIPYEFEERPAIRFILVQSPAISELIILCHHIICDGLSLAYLARDIMLHLGDPTREVEVLPDPVPIEKDTIPQEVTFNALIRFLITRINKKWEAEPIYFDQEDYRNIHQAYWMNTEHQMLSIELSEAQTDALVARCRKEEVTVNSALTTAFVGAQYAVLSDKPDLSSIAVAGNLRDRLLNPAGEVMGFYAGAVTLKYPYNGNLDFWKNARKFHRKVLPLYTNKNLFQNALLCSYREPAIQESIPFKLLGRLVTPDFSRHQKISTFSHRDDVVSSLIKRRGLDSHDKILLGTAVTNLTRLDFPRKYGSLALDRLIMNPGGAFPLTNVNVVVGAVTCAGKLSILLEFAEETIATSTVEKIQKQALEFFFAEREI
jgi:NRPS condensation-like uncharacterized protein